MKVQNQGDKDSFLKAIYASMQSQKKRRKFWPKIHNIANHMDGEWMIARDFNEIKDISKKKRLDKSLFNYAWRTRFYETTVEVLTRTNSNHHPISIKNERERVGGQDKPFKYEAMWGMHPNFQNRLNSS
ncbi:hypothetical protein Ahy_A03g012482 [Arachis hypogaea]|uniref:Uncharacterized protein n=1 Tax=Arachis hypogaea TaxID=3818 RepID=A0A445DTJ8_ARAHY|nr:hypothetical protein Ahy_A03g012482 [Arachis hypogaea]